MLSSAADVPRGVVDVSARGVMARSPYQTLFTLRSVDGAGAAMVGGDSGAAVGIGATGSGCVARSIGPCLLWIQDAVREKMARPDTAPDEANSEDVGAKPSQAISIGSR